MLTTLGVLPLATLAAPTFGVYVSIVAELTAEVAALLQISLQIGITPPELALAIEILLQIAIQLQVAIGISLPNVNVQLGLSLSANLSLLVGIVVVLQAAVSAGAVAGIQLITYSGTGVAVGAAVAGLLPSAPTTALVLGATSSAAFTAMSGFFDGALFQPGATSSGVTLSVLMGADFTLLVGLLGEFKARANAALRANASIGLVPPTVSASLQLVEKLTARMKAALTLGMPAISANLTAALQARIKLIGALSAQVTAQLAFATDGFDAFSYSGAGDQLGSSLTAALSSVWPDGSPTSGPCNVLILAAQTPEAQAALTVFFPPIAA